MLNREDYTPERLKIIHAAYRFDGSSERLGELMNSILALPFDQWPPNVGQAEEFKGLYGNLKLIAEEAAK
jgi:hypothetical protein